LDIGSYDLKLKAVSTSKSKELEITLRVISCYTTPKCISIIYIQ